MGTSKPLKIFIDPVWDTAPWVEELRAKGHSLIPLVVPDCDLILAPNCCRFLPGMEPFLDSILKEARAVKYPSKTKKDKR